MPNTKYFKIDHMSVITSKKAINMVQWRNHLLDDWDNLLTKNGRVLILGGVHGTEDGKVSVADDGLARDIEGQLRIIHDRKRESILRDHIELKFQNVGSHLDKTTLDEEKLVKAVEDFQPTVLLLAFCWTHKNELNDIFRAAGIYSVMIMQRDRADMTEGKCIFLDKIQKNVIKKIATDKPQHVFLWGSYGTGKTLLLTEALRMKLAWYEADGVVVKTLILTSYFEDCETVLEAIKSQLGKHNTQDLRVITGYKQLMKEFCISETTFTSSETTGYPEYREILKRVAKVIDEDPRSESGRTIIAADEVYMHGEEKSDFSDLASDFENVDILVALSPVCYAADRENWESIDLCKVIPPSSPDVFSCHLKQKHRNCLGIIRLLKFMYDYGTDDNNAFNTLFSTLDTHDTEVLPQSSTPVWVNLDVDTTVKEALEHVKNSYLQEVQSSITLLYDSKVVVECNWVRAGKHHNPCKPPEPGEADAVKSFCAEKGWKFIMGCEAMRGQEDKTIIFWYNGSDGQHGNPSQVVVEAISRARNNLIIITRCKEREIAWDWDQGALETALLMAGDYVPKTVFEVHYELKFFFPSKRPKLSILSSDFDTDGGPMIVKDTKFTSWD